MTTPIRLMLCATLVLLAAACAREEPVFVEEPAPIVAEPTFGKV